MGRESEPKSSLLRLCVRACVRARSSQEAKGAEPQSQHKNYRLRLTKMPVARQCWLAMEMAGWGATKAGPGGVETTRTRWRSEKKGLEKEEHAETQGWLVVFTTK